MKLAIYYQQENGGIVYHGIKTWPSAVAFIQACYPEGAPVEAQLRKLPPDWPDNSAYWVGNWGYSPQTEKPKFRGVCLTDDEVAIAKDLGVGNMSKGIRLALQVIEKLDDVSPYL